MYLRDCRKTCLLAFTAVCLMSASSITPAQSAPDPSDAGLPALLARMQSNLKANDLLVQQYTSEEYWHNTNYDKNGKKTLEHSAKYENIFVEGIPYRRKVEENGKPLSGKEATDEQARYDKAVAERRAMKPAQKRLSFHRTYSFQFPLAYLPTLFDNHILRREQLNGRDTLVIDSTPKPHAKPANDDQKSSLNWKETTWIDVTDAMPARILVECLTDRKFLKKGSTIEMDYTRIPEPPDTKGSSERSAWLTSAVTARGMIKILWVKGSFVTEQRWFNFKRFHVDMRLLEDTVQEVPASATQ